MKKYLREIEFSGMCLMAVGVLMSYIIGYQYAIWPCTIGILLLLVIFLYKAFHWKEYERENKQYIWIMLICILILIFQMMRR